jgi:hypothetical protein
MVLGTNPASDDPLWQDETDTADNGGMSDKSAARVLLQTVADGETPVTPEQIAEAKRQIAAVRAQYEGTPQWMRAPNGHPARLTETQWLQVRTPLFKAWFGDWERKAVLKGAAVKSVSAKDIPITGKGPVDTAKQWANNNPGITAKAITIDGNFEIMITPGIKDSFGHDTKYPNKVYVLPALKDVIERGAYIGHAPDAKGVTIENYYWAAPVDIDGDKKIVFIRTRKADGDPRNKLYVHEVFTEDEIKNSEAIQPQGILTSADLRASELYKSLTHGAYDVNNVSKVLDENGEPEIRTNAQGEQVFTNSIIG